jgi:hypothetical protein
VRPFSAVVLLLGIASPVAAQGDVPANLVSIELERSSTCVDVLTRLEALDVELTPLANRAQRLLAIAGAISIEESSIVDSLNATDWVEAAVRDWFAADAALAQRSVTEQSQTILDERAVGKRAIEETVGGAIEEVQAEADSIMSPTGTLAQDGAECAGVTLVRGAAIEACNGITSRVCSAARDSMVQSPFQFVEGAELLWYSQEFRPWTAPGPIGLSPQGQLSGARTIGNTRVGNVVISVSMTPLFRSRSELSPDDLAVFDSINAPLGIESSHPVVTFVPSLGIQANLARAIGGESRYVVHFGPPEEPDVVWVAEADSGAPISGVVALSPVHVAHLAEGQPLILTALADEADQEALALFSIELTSVNQVQPVRSLLGYMTQQLSADLERLIPPENP